MSVYVIRKTLVNVGKSLPFFLCFFVAFSYLEGLVYMATEDFNESAILIPYKPLAWAFGRLVYYDIQTLSLIIILSIAIKTCIYNKIACLYLALNLYERHYFNKIGISLELFYIVSITNIVVATTLFLIGAYKMLKHLHY